MASCAPANGVARPSRHLRIVAHFSKILRQAHARRPNGVADRVPVTEGLTGITVNSISLYAAAGMSSICSCRHAVHMHVYITGIPVASGVRVIHVCRDVVSRTNIALLVAVIETVCNAPSSAGGNTR